MSVLNYRPFQSKVSKDDLNEAKTGVDMQTVAHFAIFQNNPAQMQRQQFPQQNQTQGYGRNQ